MDPWGVPSRILSPNPSSGVLSSPPFSALPHQHSPMCLGRGPGPRPSGTSGSGLQKR